MPDQRDHVNKFGKFQSDEYPWCLSDRVPMKLTDSAARLVLALYAVLIESFDPVLSAELRLAIAKAEGLVTYAGGEFQSREYLWCKPGFMPLEISDPIARIALRWYAYLRKPIDAAFSDDLRFCISQYEKGDDDDRD